MNSCHLAQCEMMGHSCATRRAGAEFTISPRHPTLLPVPTFQSAPSPYCTCLDDLLNMDGSGRMGGGAAMWKEREGFSFFCPTEVVSVTAFPPKEMWHEN